MTNFSVEATSTQLKITKMTLVYSGNSVEVQVEFEAPITTPSGFVVKTGAETRFIVESTDDNYAVITAPAKLVADRLATVKQSMRDRTSPRGLPTS